MKIKNKSTLRVLVILFSIVIVITVAYSITKYLRIGQLIDSTPKEKMYFYKGKALPELYKEFGRPLACDNVVSGVVFYRLTKHGWQHGIFDYLDKEIEPLFDPTKCGKKLVG